MEITTDMVASVVVFLTTGIIALWRLRETDNKTLRDLTGEIGELKGYRDGISDISEKVINEVRSLKE